MKKIITIGTTISLFISHTALAHHPLGGETPSTLWHGLISGFAHPIIGLDHLSFIIAIGLLALFQKNRLLLPASFVGASLLGCLLFLGNIVVPFTEILIAGSVIMIGAMAAYGKIIPTRLMVALALGAGILHGTAYGSGIIGAETTPLIAYLVSFSIGQFMIALMAGIIAKKIFEIQLPNHITARLGGAVVLGVGVTFMVEQIESLIL